MFDPTSEQTVTTIIKGRKVGHVFQPILDDDFLAFLDKREKMDEDEALVLFYDSFVVRLEGFNAALPANWKELLPATEKRDVAKHTLLHCYFLPPEEEEVKDEDGFTFSDYVAIDRNERSYQLQTYYNGEKVTQQVFLRLFTAKERKDLIRVLSRETGAESFKVQYAANVVRAVLREPRPALPIIHLSALALHHLTSDDMVIEKNWGR